MLAKRIVETTSPCVHCYADLSEDTALMQSGCDDQVYIAHLISKMREKEQ